MILTLHVPQLPSGQELCDIDSLWSRKIQENIEKFVSPGTVF